MNITINELEELGVDWMDLCELKGLNEWAINEGLMSSVNCIRLSVEEFKILTGRKING